MNLPSGKNLVGVFHPPSAVVSDVGFLASLPTREFLSGLAEVIKYGVILDADLFRMLEDNREDHRAGGGSADGGRHAMREDQVVDRRAG